MDFLNKDMTYFAKKTIEGLHAMKTYFVPYCKIGSIFQKMISILFSSSFDALYFLCYEKIKFISVFVTKKTILKKVENLKNDFFIKKILGS